MKKAAVSPSIPLSEYAARRGQVLRSLKGAAGIVFAGDGGDHLLGAWRPNRHFQYLTGITNEPGAAVLFNPAAEDPSKRCVLFLKPLNAELERWDGYREEIGSGLRKKYGFEKIFRTTILSREIMTASRQCRRLACLHAFAMPDGAVSPDLALFRKVTERSVGVSIEDRTSLLPQMRCCKSRAEVAMMRHAAEITAAGYHSAMMLMAPGVSERAVQHALDDTYRSLGGSGPAYNSIVGSGMNATVLHYNANVGMLAAGDLLLIDSGADFDGYACDVTRTFPVSGTFTKEQRKVYEVVLKAQAAAIKATKVGAYFWQIDKAARDVIESAGYGDAYIHGIGHNLGLEVHDVTPDGALKAGAVVTIEPGIYLPEQKMGIRIEDDVLVTASGNQVLTSIPKGIDEIEKAMRH
ncbi:MAG: aminopeptidase P N-terminal domain-containing protein [Phycisphaerales bacterium]